MATTPRYGLQAFGGRVPGSFRDNGYAYTLSDRMTMDSLLFALEQHDHSGTGKLADPDPPSLVVGVDPVALLAGGRTYYYKVGLVDQWGLETAASDEVSVTLPAGPPTPSPAVLTQGTGGSLVSGGYYYAIAAYVDDVSRCTMASTATYLLLTGSFNKITLTFPPADPSADGWIIYRRGPQETQLYQLTTLPASTTSWADVGSLLPDCTKTPSTANKTSVSNTVTVSLADVNVDPVVLHVTATPTSGGSLAAGTYTYRVRPEVTVNGTLQYGGTTDVTVAVATSSAAVTLKCDYGGLPFVGSTAPSITVRVWGRTGGTFKQITTGTLSPGTSTVTVTDTGGSLGATYAAVTPNWNTPTPGVWAWNLYRTSNSGNYPSTSLVHHVVETEADDTGGNLVWSWTDTGQPLTVGTPRTTSAAFDPPSALTVGVASENVSYTPTAGSVLAGPTVDAALDSLSSWVPQRWTKTYTFTSATATVTGFARLYPGRAFKVERVRASLSAALSASYDVKINGTSLWGSPQSVFAVGLTVASSVPSTQYPDTSYLTVDLTAGTISSSQALMIHIDLIAVTP